MANRSWYRDMASLDIAVIKLFGVITLGTSGAIASQSCKGFRLVKTASEVGRYTVELEDNYVGLLNVQVAIQGAADTAYTDLAGIKSILRAVDVSNTSAPRFFLQFVNDAADDAEVETNGKLYLEITLKNSTV